MQIHVGERDQRDRADAARVVAGVIDGRDDVARRIPQEQFGVQAVAHADARVAPQRDHDLRVRLRFDAEAIVVATREAFRLCESERRHTHLEPLLPEGSRDAVIADAFSIDDILEAREALTMLASLPERQRADLTLLVAGFSYREIAQITGGRTHANVNKHIAEGRTRLRLARVTDSANERRRATD